MTEADKILNKHLTDNEAKYIADKRFLYDSLINAINEALATSRVSSSLLEITLEEWEHTCDDGCCYSYGEDIYLNGEKLDEQNAEDSRNALTAVLTRLGYDVEINYR